MECPPHPRRLSTQMIPEIAAPKLCTYSPRASGMGNWSSVYFYSKQSMYSFNNFFSGIYFLIYIYFLTHIGRLCLLFVISWNSVVKWEMYVLLLDANFIFLQTQRKVKSAPRMKLKRGKLKMYKGKCWYEYYVADRECGGKDIMYISSLRASVPGRCLAAGWE